MGLHPVEESEFPVPKITDEGWKVLRSQREFQVLRQGKTAGKIWKTQTVGQVHSQPTSVAVSDTSSELLEQLRMLRKQIAEEENVPAFIIFSDSALQEMAAYFPTRSEEFIRINGVGPHKLENYGEQFLSVIAQYVAEHPQEYDARPRVM